MRAAVLVALTALALAACAGSGADSTNSDGPTVVAAFYPLAYAAEQVGGDQIDVIDLTPPGAEPHDLELSPSQVAQIAEADLVLYIPGFQPAIDEAIDQVAADHALDVTAQIPLLPAEDHADDGDDHADENLTGDPHVWLNPLNMSIIGTEIRDRLVMIDATAADTYTSGSTDLSASMDALNAEWLQGTASCRSRDLVVSHEAFAYLAAQYNFVQVGIAGIAPETEPSPARLAEIADFVRVNGVTTIYYETLVDPKVAQTVAAETGATTAVLDPIEGLAEGSTQDYVTLMQANLAAVQAGQGCA
ncbi:MAG: metal ABC transporter substrate-binding protein [Candidatus Nanopelagicales bacterium]